MKRMSVINFQIHIRIPSIFYYIFFSENIDNVTLYQRRENIMEKKIFI